MSKWNLTSGALFWSRQDGPIAAYPRLEEEIECEVAVVGGGTTGALTAYLLAKAGIDVVLLERGEIAHGSTAANTGLLLYELDTPLIELAKMIDADAARRAYRLGAEAVEDFTELVSQLDDDCGLARRPSLCLASAEGDVSDLHREYLARRECGLEVEFWSAGDIRERFSFAAPAGLYSTQAMEIDPYRLTHALVRAANRQGARIFVKTSIQPPESGEHQTTLVSQSGHRIKARKVVFATGYEWARCLYGLDVRLQTTFALASMPLPSFEGWFERCMIWETARPYFYLRSTRDGRAIMGGGDVNQTDAAQAFLSSKARKLADRFHELFPAIDMEVDRSWAGAFAESRDGLPYIGVAPGFPHAVFALGYGGNGTTFSLVAARLIVDLYRGRRNQDLELFGFGR